MTTIGDIATLRSKNAGPFILTIDVFCHTAANTALLARILTADTVAATLGCDASSITTFTLPDLHVLKFSLPRPTIQGSPADRAMHGAQFATLLAEQPVSKDGNRPDQ